MIKMYGVEAQIKPTIINRKNSEKTSKESIDITDIFNETKIKIRDSVFLEEKDIEKTLLEIKHCFNLENKTLDDKLKQLFAQTNLPIAKLLQENIYKDLKNFIYLLPENAKKMIKYGIIPLGLNFFQKGNKDKTEMQKNAKIKIKEKRNEIKFFILKVLEIIPNSENFKNENYQNVLEKIKKIEKKNEIKFFTLELLKFLSDKNLKNEDHENILEKLKKMFIDQKSQKTKKSIDPECKKFILEFNQNISFPKTIKEIKKIENIQSKAVINMQFQTINYYFQEEKLMLDNAILNNKIYEIIFTKSKESAEKIKDFLYTVQILLLLKQILFSLECNRNLKKQNLPRKEQKEQLLLELSAIFQTEKDKMSVNLTPKKLENWIKKKELTIPGKILEIENIFEENQKQVQFIDLENNNEIIFENKKKFIDPKNDNEIVYENEKKFIDLENNDKIVGEKKEEFIDPKNNEIVYENKEKFIDLENYSYKNKVDDDNKSFNHYSSTIKKGSIFEGIIEKKQENFSSNIPDYKNSFIRKMLGIFGKCTECTECTKINNNKK